MKQVAGRLKGDMARFRELAAFAQFGSDLDKQTQEQLDRGRRLQEILKQPQYDPRPVENQVVSLFAGTRGHMDDIEVERVTEFEQGLVAYIETQSPELLKTIADEARITDETEEKLKKAISDFKSGWN
jgi:F-type H+-transporting ATPase subunit alpha